MGLVVTGISPTSDLAPLEAALRDAGLSTEHLQIVEPSEDPLPFARGTIASSGVGAMPTGTGVPGLTSGNTADAPRQYFRDESLSERLSDFEIPDDEVENYLDALSAGRSVVGYYASADSIDRVEAAFRAAGLAKVKRF
jgi:hypothetical protein